MQQWQYCSLRWTDEGLFLLQYQGNGILSEQVVIDPIVDNNNPASTIRRWTSDLGQRGWELASILRDNDAQEWIFKQAISY